MSYEIAKRTRNELEAVVDTFSRVLKGYSKNSMGLTSDADKATPAWQDAKKAYDRAFQTLQQFNRRFVIVYKKEIQAERHLRVSKSTPLEINH